MSGKGSSSSAIQPTSANHKPGVSMWVVTKLLLASACMFALPIATYYISLNKFFDGNLYTLDLDQDPHLFIFILRIARQWYLCSRSSSGHGEYCCHWLCYSSLLGGQHFQGQERMNAFCFKSLLAPNYLHAARILPVVRHSVSIPLVSIPPYATKYASTHFENKRRIVCIYVCI